MICAGIDAGSRAIKIVVLDARSGKVVGTGVADQGVKQQELAMELLGRVLRKAGLQRRSIKRIVATGYGRNALRSTTSITEITCHAAGVRHEVPGAMTVIDIGGQDSKLIRLNRDGTVRDFAMNDRCAAGTGSFLEVVARRLGVRLGALGKMAARSRRPAHVSSTCVVFAETEIIGLLASGKKPEDIVAGVQKAIASRIAALAGRGPEGPIVFTGGVAMINGMDRMLKEALECDITVAPHAQMTGALGAAILAADRIP